MTRFTGKDVFVATLESEVPLVAKVLGIAIEAEQLFYKLDVGSKKTLYLAANAVIWIQEVDKKPGPYASSQNGNVSYFKRRSFNK